MKTKLAILVAAVFVLLARVPMVAHHSFSAEFDASTPIRLTGTVTQVQWMNPHTYFYLDVKDDASRTVNWRFEMAGRNTLLRQAWTRSSMMIGDIVTVEGWRAKDGSNFGNARSVTMSTRRRLFAASSQGTNDGRVDRQGTRDTTSRRTVQRFSDLRLNAGGSIMRPAVEFA